MRILITNDDGIMSGGIIALEKALVSKGHEVWVSAPESQRSSCSHAVSINRKQAFTKVSEKHYSCSGYPADCVLFAFKGAIEFPGPVDLVISGINQGYNVGTDLIYSATCAAAAEGVLRGHKAIAVSCGDKAKDFCFEYAASYIADNLESLIEMIPQRGFLNVNVPPECTGESRETVLGEVEYWDTLHKDKDGLYYVCGSKPAELKNKPGKDTDFYCVTTDRNVSLTRVLIYPQTIS